MAEIQLSAPYKAVSEMSLSKSASLGSIGFLAIRGGLPNKATMEPLTTRKKLENKMFIYLEKLFGSHTELEFLNPWYADANQ